MNLDASVIVVKSHDISTAVFDVDTVDNMLYYYDRDVDTRKRTPLGRTSPEIIMHSDNDLITESMAVDWIGR